MQSFGQWIQTNLDFARLEDYYMTPAGTQRTWNFGYVDDLEPMFFDNPYWVRYKNYEEDGRDRIFGNTSLDYKLTDWLTLVGRASIDSYSSYQNERRSVGSLDPSYFSKSLRSVSEMNLDLMLRFDKEIRFYITI